MNILFVHDHIMRRYKNNYFSTGGLPNNVFQRYLNKGDVMYVYTRAIDISKMEGKLVQANSKNVICKPSKIYNKSQDFYIHRLQLKDEVKKILNNIDFCIIRLPSRLGSIILKEVKKRKLPYVVELVACTWDSLWNYGNLRAKIYAPISYVKTRKQIKNAKNVIYVSEKFLQTRYPTKGNQIHCSNVNIEPVSEEILRKRIEKIKNKKKNDTCKIGLIGSLNVNFKGHETAIKAVSILIKNYNIELHFLGAGNKSRWSKLIHKYNIENHVFFDGVLPSGEPVFEWLDELDIYLIPSLQEGLPRALVEAMSRGCPAIGVKTGGIPELLDGRYICKRKDYKTIAKKISELIESKDIMIEQSEKNFNKSKEYTKDILNERRKNFFSQIYQKIKL